MKSILDIGVTAVRASSPERFGEVADGKYEFGSSTEFYIQRPCHYCCYWQTLPLAIAVFMAPETALSPQCIDTFSTPLFTKNLVLVACH